MKNVVVYILFGSVGFYIFGIFGALLGLLFAAAINTAKTGESSKSSKTHLSNRQWASTDPIWDETNPAIDIWNTDSESVQFFAEENIHCNSVRGNDACALDIDSVTTINPATGLPMTEWIGGFDIGGNPYGFDNNDLIDHNTSFDGFNQNSLFDHNSDSLGGSGGFD